MPRWKTAIALGRQRSWHAPPALNASEARQAWSCCSCTKAQKPTPDILGKAILLLIGIISNKTGTPDLSFHVC